MGQQQLLLIVLGVIVVGVAVVAGIGMFNAASESAAKDNVSNDLMNIGSNAQQYFRKPKSMAGGGNSFVKYVIPAKLRTGINGSTYAVSGAGNANSVAITGTPAAGLGYGWTATATAYKDSINIVFTGE